MNFTFDCHTIQNSPHKQSIQAVLNAALAAVDPVQVVRNNLKSENRSILVGNQSIQLNERGNLYLAAAGKASIPMVSAVLDLVGDRISGGVVITKYGHRDRSLEERFVELDIQVFEAGHPVPDPNGIKATEYLINFLQRTTPEDQVICLISGGGSALLTSPVPPISLDELISLTSVLLASGISIVEFNILRKHLDLLKGGGLAKFAYPAQLISLILSDVVGDPVEIIASGPTVPDSSTYNDCLEIIRRFELEDNIPDAILDHFQKGMRTEIEETPKPDDKIFNNSFTRIIGSNSTAVNAAVQQAQLQGMETLLLTTFLEGEARCAGEFLSTIARQLTADESLLSRPACIVAGGETTVTIKGNGLGGRNQELALGAVKNIADLPDCLLITLATDGGDGPTDAAGAVINGETLQRALQKGLDPTSYLQNNDSYHFFEQLGDLLKPGPTMTNVNDLNFIFAF
jgi:hydroxypyruvate reductase